MSERDPFKSAEEAMKNSVPDDTLRRLRKEIQKDRNKYLINADFVKYNEPWSYLANKVVGAEGRD